MKFKFDHITNSSSCSFVVMGTYLGKDIVTIELLEKINESHQEEPWSLDEAKSHMEDCVEILIKGTDLQTSSGPYDDYGDGDLMIGIPYTKMYENETLSDFKDRVAKEIKHALSADIKPGHIEACWENR